MATEECNQLDDDQCSGVKLAAEVHPLTPGQTLADGKYEILNVLGTGATSQVYRARQLDLGRDVALKVYHAECTRSAHHCLTMEQEARQLAACDHNHIVRIFDRGRDGERHYLALELLEGESLATRVARLGALSEAETVAHTLDILSGLSDLHARGIAHRDVKLQNIVVTQARSDDGLSVERAKICDLGLASPFDFSNGVHRIVHGTPEYMAPEQVMGKPVDGRADIYAVGICMFHMLTGSLPFQSDAPVKTAYMHVTHQLPRPRDRGREIMPDLERILMRATAKDPEERYGTTREMTAALSALATPPRVESVRPRRREDHTAPVLFMPTRKLTGQRLGLAAAAGAALAIVSSLFAGGSELTTGASGSCGRLGNTALAEVPQVLASCVGEATSHRSANAPAASAATVLAKQ